MACTAHGAAFCFSEVRCKPQAQLIITPLIKARPASRLAPHLISSPLIKRRRAKLLEITCTLLPGVCCSARTLTPQPPAGTRNLLQSGRTPAPAFPLPLLPLECDFILWWSPLPTRRPPPQHQRKFLACLAKSSLCAFRAPRRLKLGRGKGGGEGLIYFS